MCGFATLWARLALAGDDSIDGVDGQQPMTRYTLPPLVPKKAKGARVGILHKDLMEEDEAEPRLRIEYDDSVSHLRRDKNWKPKSILRRPTVPNTPREASSSPRVLTGRSNPAARRRTRGARTRLMPPELRYAERNGGGGIPESLRPFVRRHQTVPSVKLPRGYRTPPTPPQPGNPLLESEDEGGEHEPVDTACFGAIGLQDSFASDASPRSLVSESTVDAVIEEGLTDSSEPVSPLLTPRNEFAALLAEDELKPPVVQPLRLK